MVFIILLPIIVIIILLIAISVPIINEKIVASAKIVNEYPKVKRTSEPTGWSVGYGRHISSRSYYRYRDVVECYMCVFSCTTKKGNVFKMEVKKGSRLYYKLLAKTEVPQPELAISRDKITCSSCGKVVDNKKYRYCPYCGEIITHN